MYDIRQFKPALYVLILLGLSGFALAAEAPGLWVVSVVLVFINAVLIRTGRFRPMPRLVANAVTVLALLYVGTQFVAAESREIFLIGEFLVLLHVVKLFEQRANRDYAQLLILSLLLMVAASINTASLVFGLMLIAYLFLSLYCALLFHLKVEADTARASAAPPAGAPVPSPADAERLLRLDQRFLNRSMRKLTAIVSAAAVVMAVVVFVLFPRNSSGGLVGPLQLSRGQHLTGFSEQVRFQEIARITQNTQVVAHVKLYHDGVPVAGTQPLLLRGVTLDRYTFGRRWGGGRWGRGDQETPRPRAEAESYTGGALQAFPHGSAVPEVSPGGSWHQEVMLGPTGSAALFTLGGVYQIKPAREMKIRPNTDGTLAAADPVFQQLVYEADSTGVVGGPPDDAPGPASANINVAIRDYALRPAVSGTDAAGNSLAAGRLSSAQPQPADDAICRNIERHLQTTFAYTLDLTDARPAPGAAPRDPMVTFLYDLKRGHCEYFAGAMTLMCQSLGMNARMVVGFKCDEYNTIGGYYTVRQSHAHTWVEVYMPDGTWHAYDPTSGRETVARAPTLLDKARSAFDFLEYKWASNVIAYDRDRRDSLVQTAEVGLGNAAGSATLSLRGFRRWLADAASWQIPSVFVTSLIATMLLALVVAVSWFLFERLRLRRRAARIGLDVLPSGEQVRLARQLGFYDDLVRLLEKRNILRPPHQTPMEFSRSLSFLPAEPFETVRRLTLIFYRIRFGDAELTPGQRDRLGNVLRRLEERLGPAPAK